MCFGNSPTCIPTPHQVRRILTGFGRGIAHRDKKEQQVGYNFLVRNHNAEYVQSLPVGRGEKWGYSKNLVHAELGRLFRAGRVDKAATVRGFGNPRSFFPLKERGRPRPLIENPPSGTPSRAMSTRISPSGCWSQRWKSLGGRAELCLHIKILEKPMARNIPNHSSNSKLGTSRTSIRTISIRTYNRSSNRTLSSNRIKIKTN